MNPLDKFTPIDLLTPLVLRFPHFPVANVSYNRNFMDLVSRSLSLQATFPHQLKNLNIYDTEKISLSYSDNKNLRYNEILLAELKSTLHQDLQSILDALKNNFDCIEKDFVQLKSQANFANLAKKLIRLSPFIYDINGKSKVALPLNGIFELNPSEIRAHYTDFFIEHLAGYFSQLANQKGFGELHKFTRTLINQFIDKTVVPATDLYSDTQHTAALREIALEEIPAIFTGLRGAISSDCSMVSVPFYGLLKNTKVFWVIRSLKEEEHPSGYVFVAEVNHQGSEKRPYIISINGINISEADCHSIFYLIAKHYKTDHIYLPQIDKLSFLVNFQQIRSAMLNLKGEIHNVTMPEAWYEVNKQYATHFSDYYSHQDISQPKWVQVVPPLFFIQQDYHCESKIFYPSLQNLASLSVTNRALVAYYFTISSNLTSEEKINLETRYQVTAAQIESAAAFQKLHRNNHISKEEFYSLHKNFGFNLKDLNNLNLMTKSQMIRAIYDNFKDLFSVSEWVSFYQNLIFDLKKQLKSDEDSQRNLLNTDEVKDLICSIPDEYIPNYWETIEPFLFVGTSKNPDSYILNRIVKYFQSYGTVEQFLEFLNRYPEFLIHLPISARWNDFFSRAFTYMPDAPELKTALNIYFSQRLLNPQISLTYEEIAQLYKMGQKFNLDPQNSFLEKVFQARNFDESSKEKVLSSLK